MPIIGQSYMWRGTACIIVAVHGCGTFDIWDKDADRYYRVSGGEWI